MLTYTPDAHGQPIATWDEPPIREWDGNAQLPEGEYTLENVSANKLTLPRNGRIVLRDCDVRRVERFDDKAGDLELVLVKCAIADQVAIEMPKALKAIAIVSTDFRKGEGQRESYAYINAAGPIYIDDVGCIGGWTRDNGQHSLDLAVNDGSFISVRKFADAGGSTSSINAHLKSGGLLSVWVSESVLCGRSGLDLADINNSRQTRVKKLFLRDVEFDLRQHPTQPTTMYCLFPGSTIDEIHADGVLWTSGDRGWPRADDPTYGGPRPKVIGSLPWGEDGKRLEGEPVPPPAPDPEPPPVETPAPEPEPEDDPGVEALLRILGRLAEALESMAQSIVAMPGAVADEMARRLK